MPATAEYSSHRATLSGLIADRRVVPVVGAGVSRAAAGLPGWLDLIKNGLDHVESTFTAERADIEEGRRLLAEGKLVPAAELLRSLLGAPRGEFPAWLMQIFARPAVSSAAVLHAIFDIQAPVLATTNYDTLLSIHHPLSPQPASWLRPARMQSGLTGNDDVVLHLHGLYSEPESVVLGVDDYRRLVKDPAYEAILRTLWLNYTLLFVGCSIDGLSDPDFTALVNWATGAFEDETYTHYALVLDKDLSVGRAREYLHERRIQLVPYGSHWSTLPAWLHALNPRQDRARAERASVAQEALRAGAEEEPDGPGERRFVRSVEGLVQTDGEVDVAAAAHALFATQAKEGAGWRARLTAAQSLLRAVADVTQVDAAIAWWRAVGWRSRTQDDVETPDEFIAGVEQAGLALFLLPEELLLRLKNRGADINVRVLDGYCADIVEAMQRGLSLARTGYVRENMARVLRAFDAVLDVDPMTAFPEEERGTVIEESASLLLKGWNAIDVRAIDEPAVRSTSLVHPGGSIGVAVSRYRDLNVALTYSTESVRVWAPQHASTPVAELSLPSGEQHKSAHYAAADGLRSTVASHDGPIRHYLDLEPVGSWTPSKPVQASELAVGSGGRIFARMYSDGIKELRGESVVDLFPGDELVTQLSRYPQLAAARRFSLSGLQAGMLGDREVLCLDGQLMLKPEAGRSRLLVVLADVSGEKAEVSAIFDSGDRIPMRVAWGLDPLDIPWMHVTFLTGRADGPADALAWATGAETRHGVVFVQQGTTIAVDRDLMGLVAEDATSGWACDDRGRIFRYSTVGAGSSVEVAPATDDHIINMLRADW